MVNTYKPKLTLLQQEILRLFFIKAGVSFNQRQIANLLEVSPPAVMKALPKLEKEGFITLKQGKETRRWSIELNRNSSKVIQLKRVDNLRLIYNSGLLDLLYNGFPGCTIVLFGSYSRGEDMFSEDEEIRSDIDIAIIGTKGKPADLTKFNKLLERTITLNFYKSWREIHKHLKDSILNGIVLSGIIEL